MRRRKLQNRHSAMTSSARKQRKITSMTENSMAKQHELLALRNEVANLQGQNTWLRMQTGKANESEVECLRLTERLRQDLVLLTAKVQQHGVSKQPPALVGLSSEAETTIETTKPVTQPEVPTGKIDAKKLISDFDGYHSTTPAW